MNDKTCDIGLVGLGVMGKNFALNMADKGFRVGVYNRTGEKTHRFMEEEAGHRPISPGYSLDKCVKLLKKPRAILIFLPAGNAVDEIIGNLTPLLDSGDLVIDGGNSHFQETDRRAKLLAKRHLLFLGMGISGGAFGARYGPSLMPGGSAEGYARVRKILESSTAQADGQPCVAFLGTGSAGHYVKMVHNGIEYAIMQVIAESYDLLRRGLKLDIGELASVYTHWNEGKLNSYLIEITSRVLRRKDNKSETPLIHMIMDRARQKGTGKWCSRDALDLGTPVPTIHAAVDMRNMSDYREERENAEKVLQGPSNSYEKNRESFVRNLEKGLFAAFLIAYAQGMRLLRQASRSYGYTIDMEAVARIWRGGCIIRAALLEDIRGAFQKQPDLENLLLFPDLSRAAAEGQGSLRTVVQTGVELGIPVPGLMSALAYYDAYRSVPLPTNLIMAQRDYFGAHRYERIDEKGTFHTEWED